MSDQVGLLIANSTTSTEFQLLNTYQHQHSVEINEEKFNV